jgi:bifunctional non-homologous end joining protein LigD
MGGHWGLPPYLPLQSSRTPKVPPLSLDFRAVVRNQVPPMTIAPIIPIRRQDAFDDPAYLFELKYDGFRALVDTVNGRIVSKNKNRMKRFENILETLPCGFVFDGEIVALDVRRRPVFNDLLFGRKQPTYIPFDVLVVEGEDVRGLPLKERKALLEKVVRRYGLEKTEPFFGEGRPLFNAVCKLDLEGIVAKRLEDSYSPKTKWWKILNPTYSQKVHRAELFGRRYG